MLIHSFPDRLYGEHKSGHHYITSRLMTFKGSNQEPLIVKYFFHSLLIFLYLDVYHLSLSSLSHTLLALWFLLLLKCTKV